MTQSFVIARNGAGLPNQDYIVLGGGQFGGSVQSPGRAVVKGLNAPQGWDIRKGNALTGATVVPTGQELSKFIVTITVWAGAQYEAWKQFSGLYLAKASLVVPGTLTTRALSITHPVINDPPFNITEVVVEDVVALEETDDGLYAWDIHFLEYRKPIPAQGRPAAALPTAAKPTPTASDRLTAATANLKAAQAGMAPPIPGSG